MSDQADWGKKYIRQQYMPTPTGGVYGGGDIARINPARWTKIYWPIALGLSLLGFIFVPLGWRGAALSIGAALILVPEITVMILHRPQDTFSDWMWSVLDVTRAQPVRQWGATHFLALGLYIITAWRVLAFMWVHSGYWLAGAATATAVWLFRHLFWGWWR